MSAAARREVIERAAAELFAEHGYRGASIDEIARRSGVTPPVLYDHFASKSDLYRRLLERHFAELRGVWREHFAGEDPEERIARSFDAWFAYVEAHPFAGRMLFRDTTGDPQLKAIQEDVAARSRAEILPMLADAPGAEGLAGDAGAEEGIEMAWVVMRGVLQGLAIWWYDHPHVPREQVVATAVNALWFGFERVQRGEAWRVGS
jgi:AcrR family transcriptional regulator